MSKDQFEMYGLPGTTETILCEPWNKPNGFVKMHTKERPDGRYIIDPTGNWQLFADSEKLTKATLDERKSVIMSEWPVEKQLEAITENALGRPEKLNELTKFIQKVKKDLPK